MTLSLATYSALQTTVLDFMDRAGVTSDVAAAPAWIQLAEARLNRELGAVETDTTLAGVLDSRRIDISAVSMVQPVALFLAESGDDEVWIPFKTDGTFPYLATSGKPSKAAFDVSMTYIDFDCPLDSAYPFRLRYRERFALSDAAPTNWLLTNHPDVYLAATMMWGAGYHEDWPVGQTWKMVLDEAIPSIRHTIAQAKRATLSVDPAISSRGRYTLSNWTNDG